jgi:hypothetical protein
MPTALLVEITLEKVMVIALSHTFLTITGLNIKIGTLCHIVHLFNTTDKFQDTLYNLSHTQNVSSSFIPE